MEKIHMDDELFVLQGLNLGKQLSLDPLNLYEYSLVNKRQTTFVAIDVRERQKMEYKYESDYAITIIEILQQLNTI